MAERNPLRFRLRILHSEGRFEILMDDGLCMACLGLGGGGGGKVVFWLYLNRHFGKFLTEFFGLMDRKKLSASFS